MRSFAQLVLNIARPSAKAPPVRANDVRWSAVSSAVDLEPAPTEELLELLLASGAQALNVDLTWIGARGSSEQANWVQQWPGEHYRFLAAITEVLQPRVVVEVGTFQGLGALALLDGLPISSTLITFDVVPWRGIADPLLTESDFADGRLVQQLGDLSDPRVFAQHRDLLAAAELVFLDAPKDGSFEPRFLELAIPVWQGSKRVLIIDDIRLLPMLQLWRDLPFAKLDATSLGHWSGTGLAVTS